MESRKCLLCSDERPQEQGWSACAAISSWDNYANGYERVEKKNDLELWPLWTCKNCLLEGYKRFLWRQKSSRIRNIFLMPLRGLGALALGVVSSAIGSIFLSAGSWGGYAFGILGGLGILVGAIILLASLVSIPLDVKGIRSASRALQALHSSPALPEEKVSNALNGTAGLLLETLEAGAQIPAGIRLPDFKDHNVGVKVKTRREILTAALSKRTNF